MISFEEACVVLLEDMKPVTNTGNMNKPPTKGQLRFDVEAAREEALAGSNWHINMVRTVAHHVAKGASDNAILAEFQSWTRDGYTPQDTALEVKRAIDGARAKGFDRNRAVKFRSSQPFLQRACDIPLTGPKFLVDELIEENTLVQIFGQSGCGKSFLAIDLACSVASGRDFHQRRTKKGLVVYVAGEGRRGALRRIHAWAKAKHVELSEIDLYVSRTAVGMNSDVHISELKAELYSLRDQYGPLVLIILDTVARNFGDGDENDTKDMTKFVNAIDALNDEFQCTTLLIHHSGHADRDRARGSSALKGALDAEFKTAKSEDTIFLECTKMKDQDHPSKMAFYLIPIDIGTEENGNAISSAYLEYRGNRSMMSARLTPAELFAVKMFREAWKAQGGTDLDTLNPITVTLEQWRNAYYRRATHDKSDSKRKAFERSRQSLARKGWITVDDDIYTLLPRTYGHDPDIQDNDLESSV